MRVCHSIPSNQLTAALVHNAAVASEGGKGMQIKEVMMNRTLREGAEKKRHTSTRAHLYTRVRDNYPCIAYIFSDEQVARTNAFVTMMCVMLVLIHIT